MARISFFPASRRTGSWVNILVIGVFLWMMIGAGVCLAGGFCAIAYSEGTGRYGRSDGYGSRYGAEVRALQECGTRDGRIVAWRRNGFVALARGTGTAWGSGSGATRRQAEIIALRSCPGGNAVIVAWAFSFD